MHITCDHGIHGKPTRTSPVAVLEVKLAPVIFTGDAMSMSASTPPSTVALRMRRVELKWGVGHRLP